MKLKVEVLACDIDKKFPAKTYTITASDGRSISKDLCAEHAEPFEEWLEEVELEEEQAPEAELEPEPAPVVPKRRAASKPATKKAVPVRRRPKIVSLEEIEASKKA
ncbi:hypothetical protein P1P75_00985 [Streptomyces sp. ID05-39B]|uniref:hypothetical protein n=1 Tax=Streptomyces sp. ID05-39B TaxID=3028664 RepID=UPI0029A6F04E|nr:hypothetical protein [Streptomyces sp. ID05-39B]MDX3525063.1 hypothetical protein [Streptomyces sp. ID05-39B]